MNKTIITFCALLSACTHTVIPEYTQLPTITAPEPEKIIFRPVTADILITDKLYITFTPTEYENLTYNMYEMKRYILQQRETIKYYKELYQTPQ